MTVYTLSLTPQLQHQVERLAFLSSQFQHGNPRKGLTRPGASHAHPQSRELEPLVDSLQLGPKLLTAASGEPHIFRRRRARKDEPCVSIETVTHLGLYCWSTSLPGPSDGRQEFPGTTEPCVLQIHLKVPPLPSQSPQR